MIPKYQLEAMRFVTRAYENRRRRKLGRALFWMAFGLKTASLWIAFITGIYAPSLLIMFSSWYLLWLAKKMEYE